MSLPEPLDHGPEQTGRPAMQVEYWPTEQLKESPTYPRLLNRQQRRKFVHHVKAFGVALPLAIIADGTVIVGAEFLLAAREAGIADVPVIRVDHFSPEQRQALEIAYIRLMQEGAWDRDRLRSTFLELEAVGIDITLTGFDVAEADLIIEIEPLLSDDDPADRAPPAIETVTTRLGDIWQVGRHRILCGDALDGASYVLLMAAEVAAAVFTDHPYNVHIRGNVGGLGAIQHREFIMASGEMSDAEFRSFLLETIKAIMAACSPGAVIYLCMDWRHAREISDAIVGAGLTLLNRCVWVKPNGGMGSFYRSRYEDVYVCRNGSGPHRNNVELGRHGRNRTNVWEYASPASFGNKGEEGKLLALHPTVKPVAMVADAILDCTARGDIVLDPFLGSGTTVIAAEKTGRRCYGMDLDPAYIDTVVRRWQAWTGDAAVLVATGQTFAQVTAERQVTHG